MKKYLTRYNIALALAAIATVLCVIGFAGTAKGNDELGIYFAFGMFCSFLAYVLGGLLTAAKMAMDIAKTFIFISVFPFNLVNMLCAFVISLIVFLCFPIFPVLKARRLYQNT